MDKNGQPPENEQSPFHESLAKHISLQQKRIKFVRKLMSVAVVMSIVFATLAVMAQGTELKPDLVKIRMTPDGRAVLVRNHESILDRSKSFEVSVLQNDGTTLSTGSLNGNIFDLEFFPKVDRALAHVPNAWLEFAVPDAEAKKWEFKGDRKVAPRVSETSALAPYQSQIAQAWVDGQELYVQLLSGENVDESASESGEGPARKITSQPQSVKQLERMPTGFGLFSIGEVLYLPMLIPPKGFDRKQAAPEGFAGKLYMARFTPRFMEAVADAENATASNEDEAENAGDAAGKANDTDDSESSSEAGEGDSDADAGEASKDEPSPDSEKAEGVVDADDGPAIRDVWTIENFSIEELADDASRVLFLPSYSKADQHEIFLLYVSHESNKVKAKIYNDGEWQQVESLPPIQKGAQLLRLNSAVKLWFHNDALYEFTLGDSRIDMRRSALVDWKFESWEELDPWVLQEGLFPFDTRILLILFVFSLATGVIGAVWLAINRDSTVEQTLRTLIKDGDKSKAKGDSPPPLIIRVEDEALVAGPGRRAFAFLIDYMLFLPILLILAENSGIEFERMVLPLFFGDQPQSLLDGVQERIIGMLAFGIYGFGAEAAFGATLGKYVLNIRVSRFNQAGRPALWQILVRNLTRAIEASQDIFFLMAMVMVAFSRRRQRVGDILSGTQLTIYVPEERDNE